MEKSKHSMVLALQAAAELTSFQKEQILRLRRHYYQQAGHIAARRRRMAPWFQVNLFLGCFYITGLCRPHLFLFLF